MLKNRDINTKKLAPILAIFIALCTALVILGVNLDSVAIAKSDTPDKKDADTVNVQFSGEHVSCDVPSQTKANQDLQLHLNIDYEKDPNVDFAVFPDPQNANSQYPEGKFTSPITEYEVLIDNIHIYIGGKECKDAFTWSFQRNDVNTLTIKKDYVVNDIGIQCKATPRTATMTLYGLEVDDDLLEQYNDGTLEIDFKTPYQNHGRQHIRTISNGLAFPVYEDDEIDVTITTTKNEPLPNIWFRTNARFADIDNEFTREISSDGKTIKIHVPHYVVRDHGSFRVKEQ